MNERQEWLDSLKEGDEVAVRSHTGYYGYKYAIIKIDRITPTRQIKVYNYTFDKQGHQKGRREWSRGVDLLPVTQDVLDSIRRDELLRKMSNLKLENLSLDQLEAINKIVNNTEDSE